VTVIAWSAFAIIMTLAITNVRYLRRRKGLGSEIGPAGLVSVIIPARNEADNLARLLPKLLSQQDVSFEVLLYDDGSEDGTGSVAQSYDDSRVRVLRGEGPPPGWVGKVHALYQATREAKGDIYLFLDADTAFKDSRSLARMLARYRAVPPRSVLTGVPHFRGGGALIVSVIPYTLLTAFPLPLVARVKSRFVAALNGQCWLIGRDLYHEFEPHRHNAGQVVEDIRIAQYLTSQGVIPYFADLQDELEVWMYRNNAEAWRGFRKNVYPAMGGVYPAKEGRPLPFALIWSWFAFLYLVAPAALSGWLLVPIYLSKLVSDRYTRLPLWVSALAPLSFFLAALLQLDSALSHARGRVIWKGRNVHRTG
jgi:glycosyltransferase involved in cell wall biosynthesis